MAGDRHGVAFWPGVFSPISCNYTISRSISPGIACLTCLPQASPPDAAGDLILTDGVTTIPVPDCRLDRLEVVHDERGTLWNLYIEDRRWRWRQLGQISGSYNQVDPHGLYYVWSLQTPQQLCELCLLAMGETGYTIQVPNGAFPAVEWDYVAPAPALQSLAESLGCGVFYRLDTNTVLVAPIGGDSPGLPDGSIHAEGPSLALPARPDSIILTGAPIRFQARFLMAEAVGEDWDGLYRRIELLSYAPAAVKQKQKVTVTPANVLIGNVFTVKYTAPGLGVKTASYTAAANTVADVTAGLTTQINNNFPDFGAVNNTTNILITGTGFSNYPITATASGGTATLVAETTQFGDDGTNPWGRSIPPGWNIQATDRLSRDQARELADKTVYRCYRLLLFAPDLSGPLTIPGYSGAITRHEQILFEDTKVEQVQPNPVIENGTIDPVTGKAPIVDYYNGWRRDQPARCYGSYYVGRDDLNILGFNLAENTPGNALIAIPFYIDTINLLVHFAEPVFVLDKVNGKVVPANVILETGCTVRDALNNQVVRYQRELAFGDPKYGTPPLYIRHDDVQLNVIGLYDPNTNQLLGLAPVAPIGFSAADTVARSSYYLLGAAARYQLVGGLSTHYNGLMPIWLDGRIGQVTWSVGSDGAKTIASLNTEHAVYLPTIPARLRIEYAPPVERREHKLPIKPEVNRSMFKPDFGRDQFGN